MPSSHANELIRLIQDLLQTELTPEEMLKCEEIVLNVYPKAAARWMRAWVTSLNKKGKKVLTFNHFYAPIMNGIIVGAAKRPKDDKFKFDTPNKKLIYSLIHAYLGTDFSIKELENIVWFTEHTTVQELKTAINAAQHHGVLNSAYVRAIVVGNRRKAAAQLKAKDDRFKKITNDPPDMLTGVPNVKALQQSWEKRLKAAIKKDGENDVERMARGKIKI